MNFSLSRCFRACVVLMTCIAAHAASTDPGVYINNELIYNQCAGGASSIMLRNHSNTYYRIVVLKRRELDERVSYALQPTKSTWIGCTNDKYVYSIVELIKL